MLFIGVADGGQVIGLSADDIKCLNQMVSNAASQHVKPPVNPVTRNVRTAYGLVMVVEVAAGLNKPYMDAQGRIWVKSGADKRQVTAREEMQRMFQQSGLIQADEMPVSRAIIDDFDMKVFSAYFERRYGKPVAATGMSLEKLLHNLNLANNGTPNLAGMLLFGKTPTSSFV
jgi:ATP-dependent DNA helicase RecG